MLQHRGGLDASAVSCPRFGLLTVRATAGWSCAGGSVRGGGGAARGCLHPAAAAGGLCCPGHRHLDGAGALAYAQGEAAMRHALCHLIWPRKNCLLVRACHALGVCARGQVLTASRWWLAGHLCRGMAQCSALRALLDGGAAAAHDADAPVQCRAWLRRQVSVCSGDCGAVCPRQLLMGEPGCAKCCHCRPGCVAGGIQHVLNEAACRWSLLM